VVVGLNDVKIPKRGKLLPKLGFCGDNCDICPRYLATQSGDVEQLRKVAALWYKVGLRDRVVSPEELICHGCSSTWHSGLERRECAFRTVQECALEKGVENCGKCEDYPCETVSCVFEKVGPFAESIRGRCSKEEYDCLRKAFFSKKENLDRVNREWRSQPKKNAPS
jgi:hypothetical protein